MEIMRWLTAGESHGPALMEIIEGVPAGVEITGGHIADSLARRRLGYGRGARMKFEQDVVTILGGVRHGLTQGGPVAIQVGNTEWPKWEQIMSSDPVAPEILADQARNAPLTRPRPGHADFTGMQKYGFDEARPVLERASARDAATLRCFDRETSDAMVAEVDVAHKEGETLGGVVEVLAYGLPPGLGSYVHWDRRLDSRLAAALMGIQAIKGVEVGDGFLTAARRGSAAHDEIVKDADGRIIRTSNRAGGIEGGMSIGDVLRVRAAMKPIATVPRALRTVDVSTGEAAKAHHQRSDVCAVPAAGVVAEAMVALVIAEAVAEKFGGDSVQETARNIKGYLDSIPASLDSIGH